MLETLVVNSEFEMLSVLDDVEHVVVDLEGILERSAKFLDFINLSAISEHLLLPTQVTANQLNLHHLRVKTEFPNELSL